MLRNDSLPLRVALKRLNLTHESKGLELSLSEDARITTHSTCKRSNLKCNACTTKWTLTNYIIELLKLQVPNVKGVERFLSRTHTRHVSLLD